MELGLSVRYSNAGQPQPSCRMALTESQPASPLKDYFNFMAAFHSYLWSILQPGHRAIEPQVLLPPRHSLGLGGKGYRAVMTAREDSHPL